MEKLKIEDIKELSTQEIAEKLTDERKRYQKMKFNHGVSTLENPLVIRWLRKDIARLMTELSLRNNQEKNTDK